MKQLFTLVFFLSFALHAEEIQRVKSMLSDIDILENNIELEKSKNRELQKSLNMYENKVHDLDNQIKLLNSELKSKKIVKKIIKVKAECPLDNQIKKENNLFPILVMKKKYKNEVGITHFKASTFRVNGEAKIYDKIDGSSIALWSDKTSFTSNTRAGRWIKVTGLFVNKVWQPASQELWIKSCDVINRTQVSE